MENAKYKNKMPKIKIKKFQLAKDSKHWIFGKKNILLLTLTSHNSVISGNTALNIYIFIYSCIHIFIYSYIPRQSQGLLTHRGYYHLSLYIYMSL